MTTNLHLVALAAQQARDALPPFCGPLGDLNRDGVCARSRRLYALASWLDDVVDTGRYHARTTSPRRRAGLERWLLDVGASRVTDCQRWAGELPPCTHPADARVELTFDAALPACSC